MGTTGKRSRLRHSDTRDEVISEIFTRVADPGGVDPDPDPVIKKKPKPYPTLNKKKLDLTVKKII